MKLNELEQYLNNQGFVFEGDEELITLVVDVNLEADTYNFFVDHEDELGFKCEKTNDITYGEVYNLYVSRQNLQKLLLFINQNPKLERSIESGNITGDDSLNFILGLYKNFLVEMTQDQIQIFNYLATDQSRIDGHQLPVDFDINADAGTQIVRGEEFSYSTFWSFVKKSEYNEDVENLINDKFSKLLALAVNRDVDYREIEWFVLEKFPEKGKSVLDVLLSDIEPGTVNKGKYAQAIISTVLDDTTGPEQGKGYYLTVNNFDKVLTKLLSLQGTSINPNELSFEALNKFLDVNKNPALVEILTDEKSAAKIVGSLKKHKSKLQQSCPELDVYVEGIVTAINDPDSRVVRTLEAEFLTRPVSRTQTSVGTYNRGETDPDLPMANPVMTNTEIPSVRANRIPDDVEIPKPLKATEARMYQAAAVAVMTIVVCLIAAVAGAGGLGVALAGVLTAAASYPASVGATKLYNSNQKDEADKILEKLDQQRAEDLEREAIRQERSEGNRGRRQWASPDVVGRDGGGFGRGGY